MLLKRHILDGTFPSAEDAWRVLPKGEDDSAFVCSEMLQRHDSILTLLLAGKESDAASIFTTLYGLAVEAARNEGRPSVWFASLGDDSDLRERCLKEALDEGVIDEERYIQLGGGNAIYAAAPT